MILACPVCRTRYRVDEQALALPAGRTVRCASCGHTWHLAPPPTPVSEREQAARHEAPRQEPALEVPPRPGPAPGPALDHPLRTGLVPVPAPRRRRSRWGALRWLALIVLLALATLAAIVARSELVAMWPPAARLYALVGLPVEPRGNGFEIGKLVPTRTADGLIIEGDITNIGRTAREVPQLRVALHDAADKELRFKIVDPPKARLTPGEVAHFKTPFEHPEDAATGVVVTFALR